MRDDPLPTGWVSTTLGECYKWSSGGTPLRSNSAYYGGEIPWAVIGDLPDGPISSTSTSITDAGLENSSAKWAEQGSLLVAMYGSIGKLGIARERITTNQAIAFTNPHPVLVSYLFWYLYYQRGQLHARGKGGTQRNISQTVIRSFPFVLAPLPEQHRIVAKLDELFSELDAGVAALERAQAKLKRYRASVLKAAVEGKMTEEWRRNNPPNEMGEELLRRILVERRNRWEEEQLAKFNAKGQKPPKNWQQKYKEPVEPNTSELPELPEGWCWATMDQFAETASGGTPSRMEPSYFGGSIPWVKSGELEDRLVVHCKETITERGLRASSARIFPSGTLCVALYGATVGKLGLLGMDAATNQAVCGIFLPSYISTTYLFHYFRAIRPQLMRRGRGGAQPNISQQIIRATLVAVPPRTEQVVIASEVDRHLSLINQTSRTLTFGIERASRVRQSILKRAFEGRLVPQDPNDEPASLLLERIRVSREAERPKKSRRSTASTERIQNS